MCLGRNDFRIKKQEVFESCVEGDFGYAGGYFSVLQGYVHVVYKLFAFVMQDCIHY